MGGGDLNMKKHFHPLTIENLERVWKAEEKKRKEEERIQQLQEELAAERQKEAFQQQAVASGLQKKKGEKLDWMYSHQQTVNNDEYLLGRKIDKNVEVIKEDEDKSLATGKATVTTSLPKASDILAKVKEDPLFLIKKREEDNRKDLVQNPLKLRKMKALLQQQMLESSLNKKSKKKKKRKHRKSTSEDEDEKITTKGHQKKNRYSENYGHDRYSDRNTRREREDDRDWNDGRDREGHNDKDGHKNRNRQGDNHRYRDDHINRDGDSDRDNHRNSDCHRDRNVIGRQENEGTKKGGNGLTHKEKDRHIGHYKERQNHDSSRSSRNYQDKKVEHSSSPDDASGDMRHKRRREEEGKYSQKMKYKRGRKDSSDDDEMEAKRLEMLNNAKWRQTQRSKNVKRYERDIENEKKSVNDMLMKSDLEEDKAKFIKKMQKESLMSNDSSVEDRIRRTIHSKQRTNAALQKKFTSR